MALNTLPVKTGCSFSVLKCFLRKYSQTTSAFQHTYKKKKNYSPTLPAFSYKGLMPIVSSNCCLNENAGGRRQMSSTKSQASEFIKNFTQSQRLKGDSVRVSKEETALLDQNPHGELYKRIVEAFPDGIQMAFAYGSGAFQQANTKNVSQNMLDFIFVVDKPRKWHRQNLEKHPDHYSFLKHFGPHYIARIQDRYGGGTYFNTLVPMEGRLIKYGIISTGRLIADLLDWESLYISGRLHKPVSLIILPTNEDLITAMKMNVRSAVHAALLLLPDMFSEEEFYTCITNLSYAGDFRMGIAEDKNKVANIVKPNMDHFRRMYGPILLELEHVTWWQLDGQIEQALTFHSRHHHLKCLPGQVLYGMLMQKYQIGVFPDLEEIIKRHAYDSECDKYVAQSIRRIVKRSSLTQSHKGILTAGFRKTIRYSFKKLMKKIRS